MMRSWIKALRIKHWIKNFFVIAPYLVSDKFGLNVHFLKAVEGAILFGLISSAIYLLNDIIDIKSDLSHPQKKSRPIASGIISVRAALTVSILLITVSLISAYFLNFKFLLVIIAYIVNNILYSFYIKNKTVIDVISIAFGFVFRIYAGGFLIGIIVTNWMVACVFCISLVLGFGKRRVEIGTLADDAANVRIVNESYTNEKLNGLLGMSASITIVAYMLYSMAPETIALHHTDKIVWTTPFVVYCIYRYWLKVQEKTHGEGPVEIILSDKGFILAGVCWILSFLVIIHG